MLTPKNNKQINKTKNFYCAKCDYTTSKKSDYLKHMKTKKHLRKTHIARNANKKKSQFVEYQCNYCKKLYSHRSTLSRHQKTCKSNTGELVEKTSTILYFSQNVAEKKEN